MKNTNRFLATTAVILICGIAASSALADDLAHNSYDVTKLTSDIAGQAENTDPVLQNAWGVAFTPGATAQRLTCPHCAGEFVAPAADGVPNHG